MLYETSLSLFWLALAKSAISIIPAVGFAMLFNVARGQLGWVAAASFIAYFVRTLTMGMGLTIELASFACAVTMGVVAVFWSRRQKVPRPVFTVPAIIPLFPGSYAFNAMIAVVEISKNGYSHELFDLAARNGLQMLFVLGALCLGIAIPSVLIYRDRPIV